MRFAVGTILCILFSSLLHAEELVGLSTLRGCWQLPQAKSASAAVNAALPKKIQITNAFYERSEKSIPVMKFGANLEYINEYPRTMTIDYLNPRTRIFGIFGFSQKGNNIWTAVVKLHPVPLPIVELLPSYLSFWETIAFSSAQIYGQIVIAYVSSPQTSLIQQVFRPLGTMYDTYSKKTTIVGPYEPCANEQL